MRLSKMLPIQTSFMTSLVLLLVISIVAPVFAQDTNLANEIEKHPFSIHDMLAMDRVSDPQVSPDGQWVAFNVRSTDLEANRGRTDIWVARTDGSQSKRLTANPAGDWNPRWCMNGTIFFLSTRSGSSQIWNIDPSGGEARQISHLALDVSNFEVSPTLHSFVFSMEVYPGLTVAETVARDSEKAADPTTGMVYDELMFRHWDTWEDGKRSHIFLLDGQNPDAEAIDLMKDLDADVPTRPWGGSEEFLVTPDGSEVIFTAKILPGSESAWSTDYDLYAVPTDGSGTIRCLTEANQAWDTEPTFTPDGKTLVYLAMDRPNFEADRFHIELMDWETGESRRIDFEYDGLKLTAHGLKFSGNGKTAYCTAGYLGQRSLFKLDLKSGKVSLVHKMGRHSSISLLKGRILFGMQSLKSPTELFTIKTNGKDLKQITDLNGEKLAACLMGEPEQMTFKGWNDEIVHAYVVKPYDWTQEKADAGQKWPLTFLVHGGPQGSFGNDFHYRWNPQAYVGSGFATVAVDFHGSTGYGQDFTDAISGHWGDRPFEDLVKGLAAALEEYPWMDADKVVATGASYGAYMINWIHGQPEFSREFKAFVSHDGNLDERMAYYDTEELWFPEWEHGGTPYAQGSGYALHNPIDYVKNWHVPTLVVHGALDYRVVDTQGMSVFTALRRQGVPARLLYFPDENHWVLKPQNSIQWHDEVMDWLHKWTD